MSYTSTELYNTVLEAMDKGKVILLMGEYGYDIPCGAVYFNENTNLYIILYLVNSNITIYPSDSTNLYQPTNITPHVYNLAS